MHGEQRIDLSITEVLSPGVPTASKALISLELSSYIYSCLPIPSVGEVQTAVLAPVNDHLSR
jgi:hypothetical protein